MTEFPWDLAGAGGLLLLNRALPRRLLLHEAVFYGLQAVNVGGILWFVFVGVDGLDDYRAASWAIAALFAMHLVVNLSQRSRAQDEAQPRR